MIGELDQSQIEDVLSSENIGRIGCYGDGITYVVPVAYVYDQGLTYGHSDEGMKARLMRMNPHVCFEVERIRSLNRWETVIAWGTFEELSGADSENARILLLRRLAHPQQNASDQRSEIVESYIRYRVHSAAKHGFMYRIRLTKMTGRYETFETSF